jgi:hypothetical protein
MEAKFSSETSASVTAEKITVLILTPLNARQGGLRRREEVSRNSSVAVVTDYRAE